MNVVIQTYFDNFVLFYFLPIFVVQRIAAYVNDPFYQAELLYDFGGMILLFNAA